MERMTKKTDYGYTNIPNNSKFIEPIDKLGQLEDIEEELGIDLITLFKAGKELAYYDDELGLVQGYFCQKFCLDTWSVGDIQHGAYIQIRDKILYLKDYGKTWALTKKELL